LNAKKLGSVPRVMVPAGGRAMAMILPPMRSPMYLIESAGCQLTA
jgi:hypothetical protein